MAEAGDFHFGAQAFRGEGSSCPRKDFIFANFRGAKDLECAREACFGGADGLGDVTDFGEGFFEAGREKGLGNGVESEASLVELLGESDRERGGDFGGADAVATEDRGEEFGVGVLFWA